MSAFPSALSEDAVALLRRLDGRRLVVRSADTYPARLSATTPDEQHAATELVVAGLARLFRDRDSRGEVELWIEDAATAGPRSRGTVSA